VSEFTTLIGITGKQACVFLTFIINIPPASVQVIAGWLQPLSGLNMYLVN